MLQPNTCVTLCHNCLYVQKKCILVWVFLHPQVLISEAIAKMIVRDLQPVSIVENQGFRELLQLLEPRYIPEAQHYIQTQLLPAYAYQAQLATRQALASAHALSLSLDIWRGFSGASTG